FWSVDKHNWGIRLQTKLPFLILPLAFSFMPVFSVKQLKYITVSIGILLVVSACYTMSFLLWDYQDSLNEYKFSGVLPTLPDRDHVRSSLAAALFIIWSVYVWPFFNDKRLKWFIGICVGILVIYM